jgi:hypothetical protein
LGYKKVGSIDDWIDGQMITKKPSIKEGSYVVFEVKTDEKLFD